jgi:hypothetical protein
MARKGFVVEFVFGWIECDGRKVFLLLIGLIQPIVTFADVRSENLQILNLACFQLHLHLTEAHMARTDHQDHGIVRHLSHRRDQSRVFRDL